MEKRQILIGSMLAMFGAILWGISGAIGQFLFQQRNFEPPWMVSVRMLLSGIFLLVFLYFKRGNKIFEIWKKKKDVIELFFFATFGMLATQYTYFVAIDASNAATATVLQYLAPVIIMLYITIKIKKQPSIMELFAIVCALVGTFLLATHGNINSLSISPKALFWGILSAFALAFYSIQPKRLLGIYDTALLIGWAMLIGGSVISIVAPPWHTAGIWDTTSIFFIAFIVVFGTLIPYLCYICGVKIVGATKASLFASLEPLSSVIVSVLWLGISLTFVDIMGFIFIICTVFLLSIPLPKPKSYVPDIEAFENS